MSEPPTAYREPRSLFSSSIQPFEIPTELGSVEDYYFPQSSILSPQSSSLSPHPSVLIIQDAHAHPEAQERIRDILKYLSTEHRVPSAEKKTQQSPDAGAPEYQKKRFDSTGTLRLGAPGLSSSPGSRSSALGTNILIAHEGAFSKVDPAPFQFFDRPELNRKLKDALFETGELTGAELFAYENWERKEASAEILGADDLSLYRESLDRLRFLFRKESEIREFLNRLDADLRRAEKKSTNREFRDYLGFYSLWKNSEADFLKQLELLGRLAQKNLGLDLSDPRHQFDYPNLTRLFKLKEVEPKVQMDLVERDRNRLAAALERAKAKRESVEPILEGLSHLGEMRGVREFFERLYETATRKGISLLSYPDLLRFAGVLILKEELKLRNVNSEIEKILDLIRKRIVRSEKDERILSHREDYFLLSRLLRLELSRKEWDRFRARKEVLRRTFSNVPGPWWDQAIEFYELSRRRDEALLQNALKLGDSFQQKPAAIVLIAGGFHTEGMTERLKEKKIPYAVISPRMTRLEPVSLYHEIMTQTFTSPLQRGGERGRVRGAAYDTKLLASVLWQPGDPFSEWKAARFDSLNAKLAANGFTPAEIGEIPRKLQALSSFPRSEVRTAQDNSSADASTDQLKHFAQSLTRLDSGKDEALIRELGRLFSNTNEDPLNTYTFRKAIVSGNVKKIRGGLDALGRSYHPKHVPLRLFYQAVRKAARGSGLLNDEGYLANGAYRPISSLAETPRSELRVQEESGQVLSLPFEPSPFEPSNVTREIQDLYHLNGAANRLRILELGKQLLEGQAFETYDANREIITEVLIKNNDLKWIEDYIDLLYQPPVDKKRMAGRILAVYKDAKKTREDLSRQYADDSEVLRTLDWHFDSSGGILNELLRWKKEFDPKDEIKEPSEEDLRFVRDLPAGLWENAGRVQRAPITPSQVVGELKAAVQDLAQRRDRGDRDPLFRERIKQFNSRLISVPFSADPDWQTEIFALLSKASSSVIEESSVLFVYLISQFLRYGYAIPETNISPLLDLMDMANAADQPGVVNLLRFLGNIIFGSNSGQVLLGVDEPERAKTRQGNYGVGIYGVLRDEIHNHLGMHVLGLLERQFEYYRTGNVNVLYRSDYVVDAFKNRSVIPLEDRSRYPETIKDQIDPQGDGEEKKFIRSLYEHLKLRPGGKNFYEALRSFSDAELQTIINDVNRELGTAYHLGNDSRTIAAYVWVYRELAGRFSMGNIETFFKRFASVNPLYNWKDVEALHQALMEDKKEEALEKIIRIKQRLREEIYTKNQSYRRSQVLSRFMEDYGRDDMGNAIGGAWIKDKKLRVYQADYYLSQIEGHLVESIAASNFEKIHLENYEAALHFVRSLSILGYLNGDYTLDQVDYAETLAMPVSGAIKRDIQHFMLREAHQADAYFDGLIRPAVEGITSKMPSEDLDAFLVLHLGSATGTLEERQKQAVMISLNQMKHINRESRVLGSMLEKLGSLFEAEYSLNKDQSQNTQAYVVLGPNSTQEEISQALELGRYRVGAKGIGLIRALKLGIPVPPFAIFSSDLTPSQIEMLLPEVMKKLDQAIQGQRNLGLGSNYAEGEGPFFLSLRASSYFTAPGQYLTFTNVGMTLSNTLLLAKRLQAYGVSEEDAAWTAWDSYRRFLEDYAIGVYNLPKETFDKIIEDYKSKAGVENKDELTAEQMREVARIYLNYILSKYPHETTVPDPQKQLLSALDAVKISFDKARPYLEAKNIRANWPGPAIIVQAMAYGNIRKGSGAGIVYTRDPNTWAYGMRGDFKWSAQGKDLADHTTNPTRYETLPYAPWQDDIEKWGKESEQLSGANTEMEFTVQQTNGQMKPWMLQQREAYFPETYPVFSKQPSEEDILIKENQAQGASGGAFNGIAIYGIEDIPPKIISKKEMKDGVILLTPFVKPEDVAVLLRHGIGGVVTSRGGYVSHTSDIARELKMTAVVGASTLRFDEKRKLWMVGNVPILSGDRINIDGHTGRVARGFLPIAKNVDERNSPSVSDGSEPSRTVVKTSDLQQQASDPVLQRSEMRNAKENEPLRLLETLSNETRFEITRQLELPAGDQYEVGGNIAATEEGKALSLDYSVFLDNPVIVTHNQDPHSARLLLLVEGNSGFPDILVLAVYNLSQERKLTEDHVMPSTIAVEAFEEGFFRVDSSVLQFFLDPSEEKVIFRQSSSDKSKPSGQFQFTRVKGVRANWLGPDLMTSFPRKMENEKKQFVLFAKDEPMAILEEDVKDYRLYSRPLVDLDEQPLSVRYRYHAALMEFVRRYTNRTGLLVRWHDADYDFLKVFLEGDSQSKQVKLVDLEFRPFAKADYQVPLNPYRRQALFQLSKLKGNRELHGELFQLLYRMAGEKDSSRSTVLVPSTVTDKGGRRQSYFIVLPERNILAIAPGTIIGQAAYLAERMGFQVIAANRSANENARNMYLQGIPLVLLETSTAEEYRKEEIPLLQKDGKPLSALELVENGKVDRIIEGLSGKDSSTGLTASQIYKAKLFDLAERHGVFTIYQAETKGIAKATVSLQGLHAAGLTYQYYVDKYGGSNNFSILCTSCNETNIFSITAPLSLTNLEKHSIQLAPGETHIHMGLVRRRGDLFTGKDDLVEDVGTVEVIGSHHAPSVWDIFESLPENYRIPVAKDNKGKARFTSNASFGTQQLFHRGNIYVQARKKDGGYLTAEETRKILADQPHLIPVSFEKSSVRTPQAVLNTLFNKMGLRHPIIAPVDVSENPMNPNGVLISFMTFQESNVIPNTLGLLLLSTGLIKPQDSPVAMGIVYEILDIYKIRKALLAYEGRSEVRGVDIKKLGDRIHQLMRPLGLSSQQRVERILQRLEYAAKGTTFLDKKRKILTEARNALAELQIFGPRVLSQINGDFDVLIQRIGGGDGHSRFSAGQKRSEMRGGIVPRAVSREPRRKTTIGTRDTALGTGGKASRAEVRSEAPEERFGGRLISGDETVIAEIVSYQHRLKDPAQRQNLYEWLQHHESALAAEAVAQVGLNWSGVVLGLARRIEKAEPGNANAAARQLKEIATDGTYGGLTVPDPVITEAAAALNQRRDIVSNLIQVKGFPRLPTISSAPKPGVLVIVRHGETSWSEAMLNKWAGWHDARVTQKGREEAYEAGLRLKVDGLTFDRAYSSDLSRAQDTLQEVLRAIGQTGIPITSHFEIRERDYGSLVGWRRGLVEKVFGGEQYRKWRRGYQGDDVRPPGGESLHDVMERVVPFFVENIFKEVVRGKNVLISAHGNSLRSILVYLRSQSLGGQLSEGEIMKLEIPLSTPIVITFDSQLHHQELWVDHQKDLGEVENFLRSELRTGLHPRRTESAIDSLLLKVVLSQRIDIDNFTTLDIEREGYSKSGAVRALERALAQTYLSRNDKVWGRRRWGYRLSEKGEFRVASPKLGLLAPLIFKKLRKLSDYLQIQNVLKTEGNNEQNPALVPFEQLIQRELSRHYGIHPVPEKKGIKDTIINLIIHDKTIPPRSEVRSRKKQVVVDFDDNFNGKTGLTQIGKLQLLKDYESRPMITSEHGSSRPFRRKDGGFVRLLRDPMDHLFFQEANRILSRAIGGTAIVVPGFADLGVFFNNLGFKKVIVYDKDPVTIRWLRAIHTYWNYKRGSDDYSIGDIFSSFYPFPSFRMKVSDNGREINYLNTQDYLIELIKEAVDNDLKGDLTGNLSKKGSDIAYYVKDILAIGDDFQKEQKVDFIFIPFLLGFDYGITDFEKVELALVKVTQIKPRWIMIVPSLKEFKLQGRTVLSKEGLKMKKIMLRTLEEAGYNVQEIDIIKNIFINDIAISGFLAERRSEMRAAAAFVTFAAAFGFAPPPLVLVPNFIPSFLAAYFGIGRTNILPPPHALAPDFPEAVSKKGREIAVRFHPQKDSGFQERTVILAPGVRPDKKDLEALMPQGGHLVYLVQSGDPGRQRNFEGHALNIPGIRIQTKRIRNEQPTPEEIGSIAKKFGGLPVFLAAARTAPSILKAFALSSGGEQGFEGYVVSMPVRSEARAALNAALGAYAPSELKKQIPDGLQLETKENGFSVAYVAPRSELRFAAAVEAQFIKRLVESAA